MYLLAVPMLPAATAAADTDPAAAAAELQHCELGLELVVLPGRLECRLPWLPHAVS